MDKFNDYINQNVASTKGLEANWVYHTMTVSDVTDMMDIMIVATEILAINMLILRCCKYIPPTAVSKLRQFLHPTFACVFRKRH